MIQVLNTHYRAKQILMLKISVSSLEISVSQINKKYLLFNMIPKELRDMTGTALQFKAGLDKFLTKIPDHWPAHCQWEAEGCQDKLFAWPGAYAPEYSIIDLNEICLTYSLCKMADG